MREHKFLNSGIVPIILLITGLVSITQDLLLSIAIGICIYTSAVFIEKL